MTSLQGIYSALLKVSTQLGENLTTDQIQEHISYLSSKLHTPSITPTLVVSQASTLTSIPSIS